MAWTEQDVEECAERAEALRRAEGTRRVEIGTIRDIVYGLETICRDDGRELDTTALTDERRAALKKNLFVKSTDFMGESSG